MKNKSILFSKLRGAIKSFFSNFFVFVAFTSLFLGQTSLAGFVNYPLSNVSDVFYVGGQFALVLLAVLGLVVLLSLNKYIFAIFFPIVTMVSFILAYYALTMNATLTVMILDATLHNDIYTSVDTLTLPLMLSFLLTLAISCLLVYIRFKCIDKIKYQVPILILTLIMMFLLINNKTVRLLENHIPYNIYFVSSRYVDEKQVIEEQRPDLSKGSYCSTDSLVVVLVLGEALRADHLGINGYERNTTPFISKTEGLVSYPHIYTMHTYTNESLPFILTRADSLNQERAYTERSFINIFKTCGFQTSWLANQEPSHTYAYFMNECDTLVFASPNKSVYTFDKWLDESLLPHYMSRLASVAQRKLIILHTIGSHWWYNSRYSDSFSIFNPVAKSKQISTNTKQEMINSYDNTIVYSDHFWAKLIEPLQNKNAVLIYLSDHGESLGESEIWLHAADSPPIHHPACFVWLSKKYIQNYPLKHEALLNNSKKNYTTDFLFHSILDASSISSSLLQNQLSIFQ